MCLLFVFLGLLLLFWGFSGAFVGFGLYGVGFYKLAPWGFGAFCCGGRLLPHSKQEKFFILMWLGVFLWRKMVILD